MAPHIEVKCQAVVGDVAGELIFGTHWEEVPNTDHSTGDTDSDSAKFAHGLVITDSAEYREVADKKGEPCHTIPEPAAFLSGSVN